MRTRGSLSSLAGVAVAAFVVTVAAGALDAAAQERPRVAVVARAAVRPPVSARATARAVRSAASAAGAALVEAPRRLAARRVARGAVRSRRLDGFARARELLDEGWNAYLRVQVDTAEALMAQARLAAVEVLDLPGGPALVAEASLRLGVARLQRGQRDEAAIDFRLARALDPLLRVGLSEFAPGVVAAFEAAVAAEPGRAPLAIDSSAIATRVAVNGRPLEAAGSNDVPVGLVAVVARAPGRRAVNKLVENPPAGAVLELRFERDPAASALEGDVRGESGAGFAVGGAETSAGVEASAVLAFAELDDLVLVAPVWSRGRPALIGQRCAGVPARCTAIVERGFADARSLAAAAQALWTELAGAATSAGRRPGLFRDPRLRGVSRRAEAPGPPGDRWYRRPWVWAAAGTAAAVVGVALGVALSGDDRVETTVVVPPCDFAACE